MLFRKLLYLMCPHSLISMNFMANFIFGVPFLAQRSIIQLVSLLSLDPKAFYEKMAFEWLCSFHWNLVECNACQCNIGLRSLNKAFKMVTRYLKALCPCIFLLSLDQLRKRIHISKPLIVISSCCWWNKQIFSLSFVKIFF